MRARASRRSPGAVVVLAGCGGQLAPTPSKGIRIGFVPKSLNQEYWVNTSTAPRRAAARRTRRC
jgi:hypothetical protein